MSKQQKYVKTKYTGIRKNKKSGTYRAEKSVNGKRTSKCFKQLKDAINWYRVFNGKDKEVDKSHRSTNNSALNGSNTNRFELEWEEYLKHKESFCATSTIQATRARGKYFFDSYFLATPLREITYQFLSEYIARKKLNADKYRINFNEDLKKLKTFFNFYCEGKARETDPFF
ncbi:MAG: hypothetical protein R3213_00885, partial [Flavobacteriaceae bacterium]|nr:hypothetical protein [Flavobacteriaceae bacterium]